MVELRPGTQIVAAERGGHHQPGGERGGRADARSRLRGGHERQSAEPPATPSADRTARRLPKRVSNSGSRSRHDLVAKINATLEPLLGADKFRAGVSVDCDLTSGEQSEETFDPDESVMLSSQKTEDERPARQSPAGVPGHRLQPATRAHRPAHATGAHRRNRANREYHLPVQPHRAHTYTTSARHD